MRYKGEYVGQFTEQDLAEGKDRAAVEQAQKETGLAYTNTEIVYKHGKPSGLKIWVCDYEHLEF